MMRSGIPLGPVLTGEISTRLGLPYTAVERVVYEVLNEISFRLPAWLELPDGTTYELRYSPRLRAQQARRY